MSKKYFSTLNYSLANEDTHLERALVDQFKPKNILAIAGSGGRSLPLVSQSVRSMTVVDMANEQLWLVELKKETMLQFSHQEFLLFWGYSPYDYQGATYERHQLFEKLELTQPVKRYFKKLFEQHQWQSILYTGKWENTFQKFARIAQFIMSKEDFLPFLQFDSVTKQKNYYYKKFNLKRWSVVLRLLGNASMFNALLYKGDFVQKNIEESHFEFYQKVFERLFTTILVKDNFFLQLCLFGKIMTPDANTLEAQAEYFNQLQKHLKKADIAYHRGDVLQLNLKNPKFDFFSFSDVPSYFSGDTEQQFMQQVRLLLNKGAIVVVRYYLKICRDVDLEGYEDITHRFTDLLEQECVQVYQIRIYQVK